MEKSIQKKPLAMGLIGHKSGLVYAQMEIYLRDFNTLDIAIRRQLYSNLADIEFSIDNMDLEDIIDILNEAKKKLDNYWLTTQHPKRDEIFTKPKNQKEEKKRKVAPPVRLPEKKEEPLVRPLEKKEKGPAGCAHYLGYLASRPMDAPLPQECLNCPKVMDCATKTSDT